MTINVNFVHDTLFSDESEDYYNVCGTYLNDNETYGLEFENWDEWLGWDVLQESLDVFGELNCLCHILYEMTFNGYSQEDIQLEHDALKQSCDEIDKAIKSGDIGKFHTIEELFNELDKDDDETIDNNNK
jgi:hypothetical protein